MMEVAKTAGFCFGVRKAVETALQLAKESTGPVYTYGMLVHNEEVIRKLSDRGIRTIERLADFSALPRGTVLIRAHGVSEAETETLLNLGFQLVDGTCPFVLKIHEIVKKASLDGFAVLIFGDPHHPEVKGIAGWCSGPVYIAENEEDLQKIPFSASLPIKIVVQTTFQQENYRKMIEIVDKLGYNVSIANTICNATRERQEEAKELSSRCDFMLVIGSKTSSNSQKLYSICKENCNHTYFVQSAGDINPSWVREAKRVGITAGASTPSNIIEEVQNQWRILNNY